MEKLSNTAGWGIFLSPSVSFSRWMAAPRNQYYQPLYTHNKKNSNIVFLLTIYWTGYTAFISSIKSLKGSLECLGISSVIRADSHMHFIRIYVYPQNPVALNSPSDISVSQSCICLLWLCGSDLQFSICLHTCVPSTGRMLPYNNWTSQKSYFRLLYGRQ